MAFKQKTKPSFSLDAVHEVVVGLIEQDFDGRRIHDGIGRTVQRLGVYGIPISLKIAERLAQWLQTDKTDVPTEYSDYSKNAADYMDRLLGPTVST